MQKILLILFVLKGLLTNAQITQIEATSGFDKSGITHFSSLPASQEFGISLNTLAFFQKYHFERDKFLDEVGVQLSVLKKVFKNISIGPTFYYNSFAGMMENITISYISLGKTYSIILNPSVGYSNKQKSVLGEIYFQGEYRLTLSNEWYAIGYVQILTNWIKLKTHSRSFQKIRIGLSKNNWQFGLAIDFDQYGQDPIHKTTPGIFLRKIIINQ